MLGQQLPGLGRADGLHFPGLGHVQVGAGLDEVDVVMVELAPVLVEQGHHHLRHRVAVIDAQPPGHRADGVAIDHRPVAANAGPPVIGLEGRRLSFLGLLGRWRGCAADSNTRFGRLFLRLRRRHRRQRLHRRRPGLRKIEEDRKLLEMGGVAMPHLEHQVEERRLDGRIGTQLHARAAGVVLDVGANHVQRRIAIDLQNPVFGRRGRLDEYAGNPFTLRQVKRDLRVERLAKMACHLDIAERHRQRPGCAQNKKQGEKQGNSKQALHPAIHASLLHSGPPGTEPRVITSTLQVHGGPPFWTVARRPVACRTNRDPRPDGPESAESWSRLRLRSSPPDQDFRNLDSI